MKDFFKWLWTLRATTTMTRADVFHVHRSLMAAKEDIEKLQSLLTAQTDLHADIAHTRKDCSYAILVGRHRGIDRVEIIDVSSPVYSDIVENIRQLRRRSTLARMDLPVGLNAKFVRKDSEPYGEGF
jgi:hypothetical protein